MIEHIKDLANAVQDGKELISEARNQLLRDEDSLKGAILEAGYVDLLSVNYSKLRELINPRKRR